MTGPSKLPKREDPYEAHRCICGHIFYTTDALGGHCRFCFCTDHRPPAKDEQSRDGSE
jgi:hypothetical protein